MTRRTPTVLASHYVNQLRRLIQDLFEGMSMLVAFAAGFTADPGLRAKFALLIWHLPGATIYRRFATAERASMQ